MHVTPIRPIAITSSSSSMSRTRTPPSVPAAASPKPLEPADGDGLGPKGYRLGDIGAAMDAAVDDDVGTAPHGVDDLTKHVHRSQHMIELAPTMIRHPYDVDPMFDRQCGVLRCRDALGHERETGHLFDSGCRFPSKRGLVGPVDRGAHYRRSPAAQHRSLSPAVVRGVYGETERQISSLLRPADDVFDPGPIAVDIQLEDLGVFRET